MIKEIQNKPQFQLVCDNVLLAEICQQAEKKSAVALDTEFVRIRTLYPKLGLIQLYDGEQVSLIDPTQISDFSPLVKLLANPNVAKILHACYEDLEVFLHYFKQLPQPMWDTQVIASFLGFPNSTGLATLIQHYFQLQIDKDASRTDWLARPLTDKQLAYAAADVWYLLPLYQRMQQDLAQTPWQSAVQFDCELLLAKQQKIKDPDLAYLTIGNAAKLEGEALMRLKLLAKWRQEEAMKRDLALNFIVRGESLWQIAKHNPKHTSELLELGVHPQEVRIHGKKMLQIIAQLKRIDEQDYPAPIQLSSADPRYKKTIKAMQQRLKQISPENLLPEVIASRKGLEKLMQWVWQKQQDPQKLPELMQNWRAKYGELLLPLLTEPHSDIESSDVQG